jgi:hypothetical protein
MPSADFFAYVRGTSEAVPAGHTEAGMRLYRHLVHLGARQVLEAHFPDLPERLGAEAWQALVAGFVRQSAWTSPFCGDLTDEFLAYLERERA